MSLVDELAAIHLVTFCGTVGFRRLKALKSQTLSISVSALQHFLIFYFNYYIVRSDGSHLQIYPHYGKHLTLCLGYDGNALQVGYYCLETRIFALQDG